MKVLEAGGTCEVHTASRIAAALNCTLAQLGVGV
jgi:hypothetical protein